MSGNVGDGFINVMEAQMEGVMQQVQDQTIEAIARVCHEANRAYCATLGDDSQKAWSEAEAWQRESAVNGVRFAMTGETTPRTQHESWMAEKVAAGWVYGDTKDAIAKTHPCLVPYDELPTAQQKKDALFRAIVSALKD